MSNSTASFIETSQIQVVLKIVELGSFSRAAAALGTTQPAISQQVKRIETLFDAAFSAVGIPVSS